MNGKKKSLVVDKTPTQAAESQDLNRELFLTPFKLSWISISFTFFLPPQHLLLIAIFPAQPSLLSWKYHYSNLLPSLAHHQWIWEPDSPVIWAPAQSFENAWPKLPSKCKQVLCNISDPFSDLPKPPCQRICHHTAPSTAPILRWVLFLTGFWLVITWFCICTIGIFLPILAQHQILVQPQSLLSSCCCLQPLSQQHSCHITSSFIKTCNSNNATKSKSYSKHFNQTPLSTLPQVTCSPCCHHLLHSVFSHWVHLLLSTFI